MYCYIDECGCASIAADAVVCAVAVDEKRKKIAGVNDSKKISKAQRERVYPTLTKELQFEVVRVPVRRIEEINIHWAKYEGMKQAVHNFVSRGVKIDKIIVDGKFVISDLGLDIPQEAVIKADEKIWQVGAASIIGKVCRDNYMANLAKSHEEYSYYDWESNAGYYTPTKHRDGIILHGPCDLHRRHFVYFQYCLDRHRKYVEFVEKGGSQEEFFQKYGKHDGKSDYTIWKESKNDIWKSIIPKERK